MLNKIDINFFITILIFLTCISCNVAENPTETNDNEIESNDGSNSTVELLTLTLGGDHEEESDYIWDESTTRKITFSGNSINFNSSSGFTINGTTLTINSLGNYELSGTLNNGQIIVNIDESDLTNVNNLEKSASINADEIVRIILNNVEITNATSAPIFILNSPKTLIVLADNSQNNLIDGSNYIFESAEIDEPNAAIFSNDDLTIYGNGSLTIDANYNDGITSEDGLIVNSGNINVTAVDDGIRGKNYLIVKDGKIEIISNGDGLKSDNDSNSTYGYISIENGTFDISAIGDAINATTDVLISNGTFILKTTGTNTTETSSKGIKGLVNIIIDEGIFDINTADDAIHSNKSLTINNGTFSISSMDDGIHADSTIEINNGEINISKSYEGIESSVVIINGGEIHIVSSDDGLNVAGGNDGSGWGGPGGGFSASGDYYIYINGGYVSINSTGDGIDANGSVYMTDGKVVVHGPTSNNNGAIDYDGVFKISGGFIIAAGSSGMAQTPGTSSTQNSLLLNFTSTISAGTLFNIQTNAGSELITFKPIKNYQSIVFSSPNLTTGTTYNVYTGGSSNGDVNDGLYENGTYTAGTKYTTFTVSSVVTKINSR
ncbi:MAG: carbohydrate-binding domain-containing protein [Melioribacteraceae bacterium]